MQVLRKLRRPGWLGAIGCLAVAVAAGLVASGVAPPARSAEGQAAPTIDPTYMYGQLFNMGYDDVYRVSGADGDPRNFSDAFNIPSTINGWQEFWRQWKTRQNRFKELRRRGVSKFHAAVAAASPTGFWRMSGHVTVQSALRNHVFDALGLPRLYIVR